MKRSIQDNERAKRLIEFHLHIRVHHPFSGLVFMDGYRETGAAIFNNYDGHDVHFTCVLLESDVGMRIAREVAWYVFHVMGCHRCTAVTAIDNIKAITALRKIGFQLEGRLREHFPGNVDGLVFGILKSEQRLLLRHVARD